MKDVDTPQKSRKDPRFIIPELISYVFFLNFRLRKVSKDILRELDQKCDSQEHKNEFKKAEKSAFEHICEHNADLVAEYLAKLFGFYLNKNSKLKPSKPDHEIESELDTNLLEMFKCIKSTDVFSQFYCKDLSARLLFE